MCLSFKPGALFSEVPCRGGAGEWDFLKCRVVSVPSVSAASLTGTFCAPNCWLAAHLEELLCVDARRVR